MITFVTYKLHKMFIFLINVFEALHFLSEISSFKCNFETDLDVTLLGSLMTNKAYHLNYFVYQFSVYTLSHVRVRTCD